MLSRHGKTDKLVKRLSQIPLFAPLDPSALLRICKESVRCKLDAGKVLWHEGECPDALALVLSGRIDIVRLGSSGERLLLNVMSSNDLIGLSTIANECHSADIVAARPTEVLIIRGTVLRGIFTRSPEIALKSLAHMAGLLRRTTDDLEALRTFGLEQRIRNILLRLSEGKREVHFTHEELADQVGATRANVSRVLKRLEREGALRCHRGRIEILNLRQYSTGAAATKPRPGSRGASSSVP